MKKHLCLLIAILSIIISATLIGCNDKNTTKTIQTTKTTDDTVEVKVWNPDNILSKPTTKDDILFGSWVTFANTSLKISALDQIERLYYGGLNFMPLACTIPEDGMLTKEESKYIKRDLTDSLWWQKIDETLIEYNMVYYFSELAGIGNDHQAISRRTSMMSDEALSDARSIIPELKNCIGVHVMDEPGAGLFQEVSKWARRYAAITDDMGEELGLDALVNMLPGANFANWVSYSGSEVKIISQDSYPFGAGSTSNIFQVYMNSQRKIANANGLKQAMFPQSCDWTGMRMPNFEEIKWQINSCLAMGATQFMYFNYTAYPNEGCKTAVINIDGTVADQELFDQLSLLNREIRALGANINLSAYDAVEVYFTNKDSVSGLDILPSNWIIDKEDLGDKEFIISLFEKADKSDEDQTRYLNIVNNSFRNECTQEFYLGDDCMIKSLEKYNYTTGEWERVNIINQAFTLSFSKSESVFLRIGE